MNTGLDAAVVSIVFAFDPSSMAYPISHHLKVLVDAGLITNEKSGRRPVAPGNEAAIGDARDCLIQFGVGSRDGG